MNKLQGLNNAVFSGTLLAVAAGVLRDPRPLAERSALTWIFVVLFVLLRLKIFMDDQAYFANVEGQGQTPHFRVGLVFGVASWIAWAGAAWAVNTPRDAYLMCGVALGISTLWIVAVAIRKGAYKEQYFWLASNAVLLVLLWLASRAIESASEFSAGLLLVTAILVVGLDFALSKSTLEP